MLTFIPIKCCAQQEIGIENIIVRCPSSVKEGEYFTVEISGTYSGLNQNEFGVQGIFMATSAFDYDEDVLVLTEATADHYESFFAKEDGLSYIVSVADDSLNNKCADKFLDCTPYTAKLKFFVRDTDESETTIDVGGLGFGVFTVNDSGEYNFEDMDIVESEDEKSLKLKIEQSSDEFDTPESVTFDSSPDIDKSTFEKAIENNHNIVKDGSSTDNDKAKSDEDSEEDDKFLKNITIKNHKINFKDNKYTYELVLGDEVNKLDVKATPYNSNALIKIVGADNLKLYSDIVKVRVELPNSEKMTYVINIKRESLSSAESKSIIHKLNFVVYCVLGVVAFILIIVFINNRRDKRKLKKLLDAN